MPKVRVITIHATRSIVAADNSRPEDGLPAAYCGPTLSHRIHLKETRKEKIGKLVAAVLLNRQNFTYSIV
jgi:hypothetical protein